MAHATDALVDAVIHADVDPTQIAAIKWDDAALAGKLAVRLAHGDVSALESIRIALGAAHSNQIAVVPGIVSDASAVTLLEELCAHLSGSYKGITSAHGRLASAYVHAQNWEKGLQLCVATDVKATDFDYIASARNVLDYLYHAGTIYAYHEKYVDARAAFSMCLALPTEVVSPEQLCAYKRLMLVSLLAEGRAQDNELLREVPPNLRQEYLRESVPYGALAAAYSHTDSTEPLDAIIQAHAPSYADDSNDWLVQKCLVRHKRHRLAAIAKVIQRIALCDIAALLGISEEQVSVELDALAADGIVASVIGPPADAGPAFAKAPRGNVQSNIVTFKPCARASSAFQAQEVHTAIGNAQRAADDLRDIRASISLTPAVLSRVWLLHSGLSQGAVDDSEDLFE
ncbi:hypothetical protein MCUN1_001517 [Malassezia cuniculi]|uniref:COP9 signalosome complex subunit 3 N-terminal helical repeats domain-containing protein n=1 Tax=Malassezia cuniculi TaxID=948313 RepID=A0AAF0EUP1_9BASI|nr:hypothetical protein MCUN1_001517 [Malassezia cuniculi]